MLVHKLCSQLCPDKIPIHLGNKLGDGADGEVFELVDLSNKVIKFSVLYETGKKNINKEFEEISKTLQNISLNKYSSYAEVSDIKYLGIFSRDVVWGSGKQNYILYSYVMEKLEKLSEDEKRVFHSILSHEDRGLNKNYSLKIIKEMLIGLSRGLDFDAEKVIFFCDNFRKTPITHTDIHVRNIMKNAAGNFKLIDFDRCILGE